MVMVNTRPAEDDLHASGAPQFSSVSVKKGGIDD
jgi:hypothetical protein